MAKLYDAHGNPISVGGGTWEDLPDKPFCEEITPEVLREYTALGVFSPQSSYGGAYGKSEEPPSYELVLGETYVVMWEGIAYECVVQDASAMMPGAVALGNLTFFNDGVGTGEPFLIGWIADMAAMYLSLDTVNAPKEYYEIGIYHNSCVVKKLDEKFLPDCAATKEYVQQYIETYIEDALGGDY